MNYIHYSSGLFNQVCNIPHFVSEQLAETSSAVQESFSQATESVSELVTSCLSFKKETIDPWVPTIALIFFGCQLTLFNGWQYYRTRRTQQMSDQQQLFIEDDGGPEPARSYRRSQGEEAHRNLTLIGVSSPNLASFIFLNPKSNIWYSCCVTAYRILDTYYHLFPVEHRRPNFFENTFRIVTQTLCLMGGLAILTGQAGFSEDDNEWVSTISRIGTWSGYAQVTKCISDLTQKGIAYLPRMHR